MIKIIMSNGNEYFIEKDIDKFRVMLEASRDPDYSVFISVKTRIGEEILINSEYISEVRQR